jgi:hypothetical protein
MMTSFVKTISADEEKKEENSVIEATTIYAIMIVLSRRLNHDVLCVRDDFRSTHSLTSSFA